jgi:hypothetical protein
VFADSVLVVAAPVSDIPLLGILPVHHALAVLLVVFPLPLVVVSRGVHDFALAVLESLAEHADVVGAVLEGDLSVAVAHALLPHAAVLALLALEDPEAAALPGDELALVGAAVGPGVPALALDLVVLELALVDHPVREDHLALPVDQSVVEVPHVRVPVYEFHLALPVDRLYVELIRVVDYRDVRAPALQHQLAHLQRNRR